MRYRALDDSRDDVISNARLSAEYVDASHQRKKRQAARGVCAEVSENAEGRLEPPLGFVISKSRVQVPPPAPRFWNSVRATADAKKELAQRLSGLCHRVQFSPSGLELRWWTVSHARLPLIADRKWASVPDGRTAVVPQWTKLGAKRLRPAAARAQACQVPSPLLDLAPQSLDGDRLAPPGASDHLPETIGALQQKIFDVVVVDRLNGRDRFAVAGDDDDIVLRDLQHPLKVVARLKHRHRLHYCSSR